MALQLITILVSRGDVYVLGEAYAFGVVWSFAMNGFAMLVLRFKRPGKREWRVPINLRVGRAELPVGLAMITLSLFALATIKCLTKKVATISGLCFTVAFFITFGFRNGYKRKAGVHQRGTRGVSAGRQRRSRRGDGGRAARQRRW